MRRPPGRPVLGQSCTVSRSGTARDVALVWCPEDWRPSGNDGRAGPVNLLARSDRCLRARLVAVRDGRHLHPLRRCRGGGRPDGALTPGWSEISSATGHAGLALAITGLQDTSHALTTRSLAGVTVTETPSGRRRTSERRQPAHLRLDGAPPHETPGPMRGSASSPAAGSTASSARSAPPRTPRRILRRPGAGLAHRRALPVPGRTPEACRGSPRADDVAHPSPRPGLLAAPGAPRPTGGWTPGLSAPDLRHRVQVLDLCDFRDGWLCWVGAAVASTVTGGRASGARRVRGGPPGLRRDRERVLLDVVAEGDRGRGFPPGAPAEFLDMAASALNDEWPACAGGPACGTRESCTTGHRGQRDGAPVA